MARPIWLGGLSFGLTSGVITTLGLMVGLRSGTGSRIAVIGGIVVAGRGGRVVSPSQRRALYRRDQGCTHPGCDVPARWCDAHHVVHWADGGRTQADNLRLLCRRHHRIAHQEAPYPQRE